MADNSDLSTPEDLDEQDIIVLAITSDKYGLNFPNPVNIARELSSMYEGSHTKLDRDTRDSMNKLKELGYVEDRIAFGSDKPYKPTIEGKEILEESDVFDYLEPQTEDEKL